MLSIQQRVEDAGFTNVVVTPTVTDRVFLHCSNQEDVWKLFNEAIDFFGMLFSTIHKWSEKDTVYESGAWLRAYGIPVHAWNTNFFQLCVSECGRFIRVDECKSDKGRVDYARILISTTPLEVLNTTSEILIDDCKFVIKLVEEWGCNLGEDSFLMEEVTDVCSIHTNDGSDRFEDIGVDEVRGDIEVLLQDIQHAWGKRDIGTKDAQVSVGEKHAIVCDLVLDVSEVHGDAQKACKTKSAEVQTAILLTANNEV